MLITFYNICMYTCILMCIFYVKSLLYILVFYTVVLQMQLRNGEGLYPFFVILKIEPTNISTMHIHKYYVNQFIE